MPTTDLRTRLQRLRRHTSRPAEGARPAAAPAAPNGLSRVRVPALSASDALPGLPVVTPLGSFQLIESRYAVDFVHGPRRLDDWLRHDALTAARLARDDALAQAELRSLAFIDTETTGLAGGSGTLVFLVGVGRWDGDSFLVRQYFLSDPNDEPALLTALVADLAPHAGWVTFNGRAFDLPLLETRLTLNRQRGALGQRPHLDLLAPARRLYRGRLASCALGQLEHEVLHIERSQADVPGYLIPQLYHDYLRSGNPREMCRVIYHNTVDILSMVTLAAHLVETFAIPVLGAERAAAHAPEDLLRLAMWHADNDRPAEAEAALRQALGGRLPLADRTLALRRLALLLKRQGRHAEAVPVWEQWASFTLDDPEPFVELAKHFEWHGRDLARAGAWANRALAVVQGEASGWRRDLAVAELERRLERLRRKQARAR